MFEVGLDIHKKNLVLHDYEFGGVLEDGLQELCKNEDVFGEPYLNVDEMKEYGDDESGEYEGKNDDFTFNRQKMNSNMSALFALSEFENRDISLIRPTYGLDKKADVYQLYSWNTHTSKTEFNGETTSELDKSDSLIASTLGGIKEIVNCRKCGVRAAWILIQSRSADEGMSTMYMCTNAKCDAKMWK